MAPCRWRLDDSQKDVVNVVNLTTLGEIEDNFLLDQRKFPLPEWSDLSSVLGEGDEPLC